MTGLLEALVVFANFVVLPAIAYGAQIGLAALGVTLVFGVLRFAHVAHGDLMAFGTMVTIVAAEGMRALGLAAGPVPTALVVLPLGILASVLVSLAIDQVAYAPLRERGAQPAVLMIASIGVVFILSGLVRMLVGPETQYFADGSRFFLHPRDFRAATGLDEGLMLRSAQALTILIAVAAMAALFAFLHRSRSGRAMRAYADNPDLAFLCGVSTDRVVRITWVIAAALAATAGVLYGLDKAFSPATYFHLVLPVFAAVILGGIGNPRGAVLGAFVIAFAEIGLTYAYRGVVAHLVAEDRLPAALLQPIPTDYKLAIGFAALVAILILRPTGLFARASS